MPTERLQAFLMDYAAGNLGESSALAIALHLYLSERSRAELVQFENMGAGMMCGCGSAKVSGNCRDKVLAAIETVPVAETAAPKKCEVPVPLRAYIGEDFAALKWQELGGGVTMVPLAVRDGAHAQLIKIPAGHKIPEHTHHGIELTVVLKGSVVDGTNIYQRGDIAILDETMHHQPMAGSESDCVCLLVAF